MGDVTFREVQKIGGFWAGVIVFLLVPLPTWTFIQQIILEEPVGNNPAPDWAVWLIFLFVGMALPLFILSFRLEAEVRDDGILIRFLPVKTRSVPYGDILNCRVRTYRPIREYGGWGIKWGPKAGWSYTLSGNQGVQLELKEGKRLLIGSYRAEELAKAIEEKRVARA